MASSTKKLPPYNRSMPGKRNHGEKVKAHALKVGEITWAWNRLQASFCLVFCDFINTEGKKIGSTIWNAIASDKTQREVLLCLIEKLSIAEEFKDKYKLQFDNLKYALKEADELSSYRNAFVHTPMLQNINDGSVSPFTGTAPKKYTDKIKISYQSKTGFKDLLGDIIQLEQFVSWTHFSFSVENLASRDKPLSRVLQPQSLAKKNTKFPKR